MPTLLVIDGHNLLFQMFFGMPARITNKDGKAIQGTLGFVGALLKIMRMIEPTHIVALFDGEHENDRSELDAEYKANRTDYSTISDENNPFSQLPDLYTALDYMEIKHTEVMTRETDDVIASYALTYCAEMKIVIASFDSDFFQLINDSVTVLRYRNDKTIICDCGYIQDKYGVSPQQYADFKSLTGDPSDNIKGADKIGPKTAAQLLGQFGTLNEILTNSERISKPSICGSIKKNADRLRVNNQLIKLDNKVPLPFAIEELDFRHRSFTTNEVLTGIGFR